MFKIYNQIWRKVSISIKKELDSQSVYNKKNLRTKIKSYEGKININVHDNGIAKELVIAFIYQ